MDEGSKFTYTSGNARGLCSYSLVANIVYETSTNVDLTTNTWG